MQDNPKPRRVKIERGVYRSISGKLEVCYIDSDGKPRFEVQPSPNITAARDRRDELRVAKRKGEVIRPNPRLKFGEARSQWLEREVSGLKPKTRESYAGAAAHLPWGNRRMDSIDAADVAKVIRDGRAKGSSEWTLAGIVKAASAVFKFARRELRWAGANPVDDLSRAQRPKPSQAAKRRLHSDRELEATLAAAGDQWKAPLALIAATGARESEALAIQWRELHLDDDVPYAEVAEQLTRAAKDHPAERVELKTQESAREVALPRSVVTLLKAHKLRSRHTGPDDYVFATANGTPVSQRNLLRELDRAQRVAVDEHGDPVFPTATDDNGERVPRRAAGLPTIHGMRHTFASALVAEGESVDEVAWTLGHKDGRTTRAVYVHEVRSAEVRSRRLARAERNVKWMASADGSSGEAPTPAEGAEVVSLSQVRDATG